MPSVSEIWERIRHRPNVPRAFVEIPAARVLTKLPGPQTILPNRHYFGIIVDELFLADARQWRKTYDPMVLSITEFTHAGKDVVLPFVVGPKLLGSVPGTNVKQVPEGMLYRRTQVAGIHPYRGGKVVSTVILCQVQRGDFARQLLQVVEGVAGAVSFGHELETFIKLSGTLLDGMDTLLGQNGTVPLVGIRQEFSHDLGDPVRNAFFALIDAPEQEYPVSQLWVRDGSLWTGPEEARLSEIRKASYVLFSTRGVETTSELTKLPQQVNAEAVIRLAASNDEKDWERTKSELLVLYRELLTSPDLTRDQAKMWFESIKQEVVAAHQTAKEIGNLGPEVAKIRDELREAVSILQLE